MPQAALGIFQIASSDTPTEMVRFVSRVLHAFSEGNSKMTCVRRGLASVCYSGLLISWLLFELMSGGTYLPILVLLVAAIGFALAPLFLAWLWARAFSPRKPGASKNAVYECGLEPTGDAWIQFKPGYYLYAIIFLVFDVEAIFLLPFAVSFTGLSMAACIAMLVFVLLLVEGLVWAWQKNVLVWN